MTKRLVSAAALALTLAFTGLAPALAGTALVGNENGGTHLVDRHRARRGRGRDQDRRQAARHGDPRIAPDRVRVATSRRTRCSSIDLDKRTRDQARRPRRIARRRLHLARRQADRRGGRAHEQRRLHRHRHRCGGVPGQDRRRQPGARGVLARRALRLRQRGGGRQARGDRRRGAQDRRAAESGRRGRAASHSRRTAPRPTSRASGPTRCT